MAGAATRDENRAARPSSALVRQSQLVHGRFSFKDEVGGATPPRPTIRPLTSRNARSLLRLRPARMHRWSATKSVGPAPLCGPRSGCLTSSFAGTGGLLGRPCLVAQRSDSALLRVLMATRPG